LAFWRDVRRVWPRQKLPTPTALFVSMPKIL
jgi:hypothetical protein